MLCIPENTLSIADRVAGPCVTYVTSESTIGHILLIFGPSDALVLEQVNDGEDVVGVGVKVIRVIAKVVAANSGNVIRLAGMLRYAGMVSRRFQNSVIR